MNRSSASPDLRTEDSRARLTACSVFDRPLVLEAGAGTGKTAVLVGRLVAWGLGLGWERAERELAAQGTGSASAERVAGRVLEGVVAITFTEAAAAEMATRAAEALAAVAKGNVPKEVAAEALPADPEVRLARAGALVLALDRLAVSTIHAFCRRLLTRYPLEAGMHPTFEVDAELQQTRKVVREIVEIGFREALQDPPDADWLGLFADGIDPSAVGEALLRLIEDGTPAAALAQPAFTADALARLSDAADRAVTALRDAVAAPASSAKKARTLKTIAEAVARSERPSADGAALSFAELAHWADALLDENQRKRLRLWANGELSGAEEENLLGESRERLAGAASSLLLLLDHLIALDAEGYERARRVLAPLLAKVERELSALGVATFSSLLRGCRDLLCGHPEVTSRVRREIRQLLVDEFQDTDRVQCEILHALALDGPSAERPGLFLVGDPKQSIYGWRDADLAAYEGFVGRVKVEGGQLLRLVVNFRSVPPILDEVGRVIGPVMLPEPGVQPEFQPLVACDAHRDLKGFRQGRWAPVEHWVSSPRDSGGDDVRPRGHDTAEREARFLARDVRALGEDAGVQWSRIGILFRSTGDLDTFLQALRDEGVPYLVEKDRSYYRRREIIDAAALVRTVLDCGDQLALVTWLRSPSVGVPDAALVPLWLHRFPELVAELGPGCGVGQQLGAVIRQAARDMPSGISSLGRVAGWEDSLENALAGLAELRSAWPEESVARFVERLRLTTLVEATEAARTLGAYRLVNLERFFRRLLGVLDDARGDREVVLRFLRTAVSESREERGGRPREAGEDAVRVMTIHVAKGLDFDHVYLMQTHKQPRPGTDSDTRARRHEDGFETQLLGWSGPGWLQIEEQRKRVAAAETVRTLYVALTRAKQRLVTVGSWPLAAKRPPRGSHLELLRRRRELPDDLAALADRVAAHDGFVDAGQARWVFIPDEEPTHVAARRSEAWRSLSPEEVARQSEKLLELKRQAEDRMRRPFSAAASAEAHALLDEGLAGIRSSREYSGAKADRGVATAVGSVIHRVLEVADLGRPEALPALAEELAPIMLEALSPPALRDEATQAVAELTRRLASSKLGQRLQEIAPAAIAREVPVLLPPGMAAAPAAGYVAGKADLLYRDPKGGQLVVVDYKTDRMDGETEIGARAAAYTTQGRTYAEAIQGALRLSSPPRVELWFLAADRIVVVE